jgi:hypothetical protein
MYGGNLENTHFSPGVGQMTKVPDVLFKTWGGEFSAPPVLADLNGDGWNEIIVGSWRRPNEGMLQIFDLKPDTVRRVSLSTGNIYYSAAVGDLDLDGDLDIVASGVYGKLYGFTNNGSLNIVTAWVHEAEGPIRSSPTVVDIYGDSHPEVIFGADDRKLHVLRQDGTPLWSFEATGPVTSTPAVVDIDKDGKLEMIFVSDSYTGVDSMFQSTVYAINHDRTLLWKHLTEKKFSSTSNPVVADLDGDQNLEVVFTGIYRGDDGHNKTRVSVLSHEGNPVWDYDRGKSFEGVSMKSSVAVADMDGDGKLEVLMTRGLCLTYDGAVNWWADFPVIADRDPIIADMNGDGTLDFLAPSAENFRCGSSEGGGKELWGMEFVEYWTHWVNSPVVGDIDGDGSLEIAVGATDGNLYVLAASKTGKVAGWVKDSEFEEPIAGAYVEILGTDRHTYTDAAGNYLMERVPIGTCVAKATAMGYSTGYDTIAVAINETTEDVNFILVHDGSSPDTLTGSISGYVLSSDSGLAISRACVSVYPSEDNNVVATSETDTFGYYQVLGLVPGDYHVVADAYQYEREWWEEVATRADGAVVAVEEDEDTPGINFTLDKLARGGISGTVVDTLDNGIPFATVWAQGISNWVYKEVKADNTGAYFVDVIAGVYDVGAIADGYESGAYPYPVPVLPDSVTSGIDIALTPLPETSGTICGTVMELDSTGIKDALVITFADPSAVPFFGYAFSDGNGAYTIENVPLGEGDIYYVIAFAWGYIPEFYDDVYSWTDATPVGVNAEGIDFALKTLGGGKGGGKGPMGISGRISCDGDGLENAIVYAMDGEEVVAATRSLDNGNYLLSQLSSGTYSLRVSRVGHEDVAYGPVSVLEGSVAGTDVELPYAGVSDKPGSPEKRSLWLSVAPNIVNHSAAISYAVPAGSHTELSIYNASGRRVVTLVKEKTVLGGTHRATLNARELTQGIYFVKLSGGKAQSVKKLIILR